MARSRRRWRAICIAVATALALGPLEAGGKPPAVSIAAAANLVYVIGALNAEFSRHAPEVRIIVATSASGSLFAQITHGAPFDLFLSADTEYPLRVVQQNLGERASLCTFATGRLVFWTTRPDLPVHDIAAAVRHPATRAIAIAQPQTAPYGQAARAVLAHLAVAAAAEPKLVIGESITQTAQFVETGNADCGFVALSLVRSGRLRNEGRWVEIPPAWHSSVSLDHAAVLTRRGADNPAARRYLEFLATPAARDVLRKFGYAVP